MTQTAQKTASVVARIEIKKNGIVVYRMASSSGHSYNVTVFDGKVSSCERVDHEPCKGWKFNHKCHHATAVTEREAERTPRLSRDAFCDEFGIYQ